MVASEWNTESVFFLSTLKSTSSSLVVGDRLRHLGGALYLVGDLGLVGDLVLVGDLLPVGDPGSVGDRLPVGLLPNLFGNPHIWCSRPKDPSNGSLGSELAFFGTQDPFHGG